jgi:hypothetical protein
MGPEGMSVKNWLVTWISPNAPAAPARRLKVATITVVTRAR